MHIRKLTYKKEDVDCKLCTEYRGKKHPCPHDVCPFIAERIEAGAVTYWDAVNTMISPQYRFSRRLPKLAEEHPGTFFLDDRHRSRMEFLNTQLGYVPGRNTPAYYAAMYLLTANEIIYWRMANCFCYDGIDFRYAILRGISTYNYALYRAALALTTDRQGVTVSELDDTELIEDEVFRLIINAIYMQKPDATVVAGFNKWRDQFGHNVLKGEKGIKIIAPTPYKKKIEEAKLDPDTKLPMLDADGKAIMEEKEIRIPMYKPVTVFDVSQTEGKPLPQLAADLTGSVQNYEVFMEAVKRSAPVPVFMENMTGMDGYYDDENRRIAVRTGMSEVQTVCAAIHEIAHSLLHGRDDVGEKYQVIELFEEPALYSNGHIDREKLPEGLYAYDLRGSDDDPGLPVTIQAHVAVNHAATVITATPIDLTDAGYLPLGEDGLNFVGGEQTVKGFLHEQFPEKAKISRNTEEVQAESISYAVCAYFGIETGENSFGYIATWSKDKELPELKASLETINRTASGLITDIDRNFKVLMKERGLDKEPESLAAEPVQEITVQEPEPVSAPDNGCVPDPAISVETMNAYGYTDSNMLPLTKERALELMERDVTVYMLHTDNTEAMAFDADEIRSFDGIFGVEASEWETVKDIFAPQDYEKAFLDNPDGSFAIYQLIDNNDTARLHFMNYAYLDEKGLSVQKENYAAVYAGTLDRRGDTQDRLNELYETFNIRRPEDFCGHSLSVSDIIALKQNNVISCYYVDTVGFKEVPDFLQPENYLKNAEMATEDDYGMIDGIVNNGPRKTVAELEEQSKTGTPISLLELAQAVQREDVEKRHPQQPVRREKSSEKPSILAKLKASSVADTKSVKSAPKRSAEREL